MAVYKGDGGAVTHAELALGMGMVVLGSVNDSEYGALLARPHVAGGVTMSVYCIVDDVDAHCARARAARESVSQDYGGRDYTCKDSKGTSGASAPTNPWAAGQGH